MPKINPNHLLGTKERNTLNDKQRITLGIAAAVAVGMILFPPFHFVGANGVSFSRGYHFIFSPPLGSASINITTLSVQLLGIAIVGGALWLLSRDR